MFGPEGSSDGIHKAIRVGVKTGSDDAAGGCLAFRAIRRIDGRPTTITGVVLGQPGRDEIAAGFEAAEAMVDRLAGRSGRVRGLPPPGRTPPAPRRGSD